MQQRTALPQIARWAKISEAAFDAWYRSLVRAIGVFPHPMACFSFSPILWGLQPPVG